MIPNIIMCGKTGTVQNPRGKNHSVFIGFAPRDNPKIAIAVIVENAGYGSSYAAPIGSYITEKYLKDSISIGRRASVEWMKKQVILPVPPKPKVKLKPLLTDSAKKDSILKNTQKPTKGVVLPPAKPVQTTKPNQTVNPIQTTK
ncbi:Penicillin binding protein transpeptidase domain protein [compost metagenome]